VKNKWLEIPAEDWEKFDMRTKVMKSDLTEEEIKDLTSSLYRIAFSPKFIIRQILQIRGYYDFLYLWRAAKKLLGKHLKDFS